MKPETNSRYVLASLLILAASVGTGGCFRDMGNETTQHASPETTDSAEKDDVETCRAMACAELGVECGQSEDNCGMALDCGACSPQHTCDKGKCLLDCPYRPPDCTYTSVAGHFMSTADAHCGDENCPCPANPVIGNHDFASPGPPWWTEELAGEYSQVMHDCNVDEARDRCAVGMPPTSKIWQRIVLPQEARWMQMAVTNNCDTFEGVDFEKDDALKRWTAEYLARTPTLRLCSQELVPMPGLTDSSPNDESWVHNFSRLTFDVSGMAGETCLLELEYSPEVESPPTVWVDFVTLMDATCAPLEAKSCISPNDCTLADSAPCINTDCVPGEDQQGTGFCLYTPESSPLCSCENACGTDLSFCSCADNCGVEDTCCTDLCQYCAQHPQCCESNCTGKAYGDDDGCGATCTDCAMVNCECVGGCTYLDDDFADGALSPWVDLTALAGFTADIAIEPVDDNNMLRLFRGSADAAVQVVFDRLTSKNLDLRWEFDIRLGGAGYSPSGSKCEEESGPCSRVVCSLLHPNKGGVPEAAYTFIVQGAEWAKHGFYFRRSGKEEDLFFLKGEPDHVTHKMAIARTPGGMWEISFDGVSYPGIQDTTYDSFIGVYCNGSQSTSAGHGGWIDNVKVYSQ